MLDHIGLKVKDLDRSVRFYEAALAPLGYVLCTRDGGSAGLGPSGQPALWLYGSSTAGGPTHVALQAKERNAVARFHGAALAAGGKDNGAPVSGRSTPRTTTLRSSSTPTATTSRPSSSADGR